MSRSAGGRPTWTSGSGGSDSVEPVEVHDLVPRSHEVVHELLLRVVAGVDLREGPQLGVRAEYEVDPAAGPRDVASGVVTLEGIGRLRRRLPRRAQIEQVDEEVVGQRS